MKFIYLEGSCEKRSEVIDLIASAMDSEMVGAVRTGLQAREDMISSGLVNEIAIPHTMVEIDDAIIVLVKNDQVVGDWETIDGSGVKYAISIIAPKGCDDHLKILSEISRKLMDDAVVEQVKACSSSAEVAEILNV